MATTLLACAGVIAVTGFLFKLLYDRHSARQLARMNAIETLAQPSTTAEPDVEDPYRSAASGAKPVERVANPDDELARLAASGARRAQDDIARQHAELVERRERVRRHRLWDAMTALPDAPPANVVEAVPAEAELPPSTFDPGDWMALAPLAQDLVDAAARKAHRESAWLASLPFAMERYFAILAENPDRGFASNDMFCIAITIELSNSDGMPTRDILEGVMHAHDPRAGVMSLRPLVLQSGGISCWSSGITYTNQRIAPYVHGLVDKVLLPLHRSHPIVRVSLECV
jgi:hypothetical protein